MLMAKRVTDKAYDVMKAAHMEAMRKAKEKPVEESLVSQEELPEDKETERHREANEQEHEELDEVMHLVREYKDAVWPKQHPSLQASGMAFWDKIAELVEERRAAITKTEQEWTK